MLYSTHPQPSLCHWTIIIISVAPSPSRVWYDGAVSKGHWYSKKIQFVDSLVFSTMSRNNDQVRLQNLRFLALANSQSCLTFITTSLACSFHYVKSSRISLKMTNNLFEGHISMILKIILLVKKHTLLMNSEILKQWKRVIMKFISRNTIS